MNEAILLLPILIPAVAGALVLAMWKLPQRLQEGVSLLAALANLVVAGWLFNKEFVYVVPWAHYGMDFSLRIYQFSGFILLAAAGFSFLVTLFSMKFMRGRPHATQYYAYLLLSVAMVNGGLLANHLIVLIFFWEGLLVTTFGMIAIGNKNAFKTATKAFIIVGVADLCMLLGVALTGWIAGSLTMTDIHVPLDNNLLGSVAMGLMMIGAITKAGSMPFHSWIPDAAVDAPLPFMAFMPGSLEKLIGIYLLTRISLNLFLLTTTATMSMILMVIGAATIVLAVMMALVQKDYKRLLSYHAISQVGYMILGIGTAVPIGIVGGIFHMINNALYKSCLFLSAGAVEKQAGTTNIEKLGGLARKMPITFACFFIAAVSICGVPPFNGFFSKELVYDAAMQRGVIFYIAAVAGSFFTAASFLKLGHSVYLGPRSPSHDTVKEAPPSMLAPMIVIASICVLFGVCNPLPLNHLIQPIIGVKPAQGYAGWPASTLLVVISLAVLAVALISHLTAAKRSGGGVHATDYIHYAPVLGRIYDRAEKRYFDPYDIGMDIASIVWRIGWFCDRAIDWLYDVFTTSVARGFTYCIRAAHTGDYAMYVLWSLAGAVAVVVFMITSR